MSSSDTDHVLHKHKDRDEFYPYAITSEIMACDSYPTAESASDSYWVVILTNSSGRNYVLKKHKLKKDLGQYGLYAILSEDNA